MFQARSWSTAPSPHLGTKVHKTHDSTSYVLQRTVYVTGGGGGCDTRVPVIALARRNVIGCDHLAVTTKATGTRYSIVGSAQDKIDWPTQHNRYDRFLTIHRRIPTYISIIYTIYILLFIYMSRDICICIQPIITSIILISCYTIIIICLM